MQVFIYVLIDPLTKEIRYVGKTRGSLNKRLTRHLREERKKEGALNKRLSWLRKLRRLKLKPLIEEIDKVEEDNWIFWERHYISLYKSWGFNLILQKAGMEMYYGN